MPRCHVLCLLAVLTVFGCKKKTSDADADAAAAADAAPAASAEVDAGDPNAAVDAAPAVPTATVAVVKDAGTGPRGDCTLGSTKASVPIKNADAVLAGLRPKLKSTFVSGLEKDKTLGGTLAFSAKVAADGTVSSVDGQGPGLGAVLPSLKSVIQGAKFEAPGKPSILNGTVDCRAAK